MILFYSVPYPLPDGLGVDTNSGSSPGALVRGSFSITIGVANAYGSDSETLTLNLASGAPAIISSLVTKWQPRGNL